MSTELQEPRCGELRNSMFGWRREPCVLPAGHDGEHDQPLTPSPAAPVAQEPPAPTTEDRCFGCGEYDCNGRCSL